MDLYTATSYQTSRLVTKSYSTSFGMSIRLFGASLRPHIYALYGLVRIADEIVDTYTGKDRRELLNDMEAQVGAALTSGYSTNPIIHAFATTARQFSISDDLISPFFYSMRMDLEPQRFDQALYEMYINGSAEVVGLMCLKVFMDNAELYSELEHGARRLGAAYQKVNFLRDIAADTAALNRWYFPTGSFKAFDDAHKLAIVHEITEDFDAARSALRQLPASSRKAVTLSYHYYQQLLRNIERTPAALLKKERVRVPDVQKIAFLVGTGVGAYRV
jgi:phytoene synthase